MATAGSTTIRQALAAALAETQMQLISFRRYPGLFFIDIFIPLVFAALPILLGRAGGPQAIANFEANTGTSNYVGFMLIGSSTFMLVTRALWDIGYWIRFEQETGTLEAVYLTPTSSLTLAAGVALYSAVRGVGTMLAAYSVGSLIFGVNPLQGEVLLALVFILVGLIPLYSVAFLFGALILVVKEANALIGVMQWLVSYLMGIFFPVLALPPLMRLLALLFPPTWIVNGVRSALLGVGYFFKVWYLDLAVLWAFLLLAPLFSTWVFRRVESGIRRNQGMGEF